MKVPGEGPRPARLMFVGEGPGKWEEQKGRPFYFKAPTGREFDRYLQKSGIRRDHCYVTNLVKWRVADDGDPTEDDIVRDLPELLEELEEVQPEVIATLGAASTRFFLGAGVAMDQVHSIPHLLTHQTTIPLWLNGRQVVVVPIIHPASGLHSPESQPAIWYGFQTLKRVLRGEITSYSPQDQFPLPQYFEMTQTDHRALEPLFRSILNGIEYLAIDTENGKGGKPWGLSLSTVRGEAWVIRHYNITAIAYLRMALEKYNPIVVLHNALHDLPVLEAMGIRPKRFTDTMVMSFLLGGVEPQGLKPLAYRHCGMQMSSYVEVLWEVEREITGDYILRVAEGAWPKPDEQVIVEQKGARIYKPQSAEKCATRIIKELAEGKEVDCRKRWEVITERVGETVTSAISSAIGTMPEVTLDDVVPKKSVDYSARDADATLRVLPVLLERVKAEELEDTLALDIAVIPYIARMQHNGMLVDPEHFPKLTKRFLGEIEELDKEIHRVSGEWFQVSSPDQVAQVLFGKLKLPTTKLTPSRARYSADDKALETIRDEHPVVPLILQHRELTKLENTYSRKLPQWIDKESKRIHPRFRITRVPSGRLSCADPNLMAIPTRTDLGRLIRRGFIAGPGRVLGSWDFDQIEMRVLCHESKDDNMAEVFWTGRDIHSQTTSLVFGIPYEKAGKGTWQRDACGKHLGFGIVYEITALGLQRQVAQKGKMRVSVEQCQEWIDLYTNEAYPGVGKYQRKQHELARRYGWVRENISGRKRLVPGVHSPIDRVRAESERAAGNHPIQGGASAIIKRAMSKIWSEVMPVLDTAKVYCEPLLQVHDELVWELDENAVEMVEPLITAAMESAVELDVPVKVSSHFAKSWGELK